MKSNIQEAKKAITKLQELTGENLVTLLLTSKYFNNFPYFGDFLQM